MITIRRFDYYSYLLPTSPLGFPENKRIIHPTTKVNSFLSSVCAFALSSWQIKSPTDSVRGNARDSAWSLQFSCGQTTSGTQTREWQAMGGEGSTVFCPL